MSVTGCKGCKTCNPTGRTVKLKSEFPKEDPSFLTDKIYVPHGFFEMVDDFIYMVLRKQPGHGTSVLVKFGRNHFSELLTIITSNIEGTRARSIDTSTSSILADEVSNDNRNQESGDKPLFAIEDVILPEGLNDGPGSVISGLMHRVLTKTPEEVKRNMTKLDVVKMAFDHFEWRYRRLSDASTETDDTRSRETNRNHSSAASEHAVPKIKPSPQRRLGVSSEGFQPTGVNHLNKFPKDAATMEKLKKAAQHTMPLKHLDEKNLTSVLEVLKPLEVKAGSFVTRQGDDGNDFFIVDSGTYHIFKLDEDQAEAQRDSKTRSENDKGKLGELIKTWKNEGSFGELALMYNWPRQASVKAVTDGKLWVLDRATYQMISGNGAFEHRRELQTIMGKVKHLQKLNPEEILDLCDAIDDREFGDGMDIVKQGDSGKSMFFVLEGEAVVTMKSREGVSKEIQRLSAGSYFGEMALITKKKRQATVTASGKIRCGELDVDAFERLLGPCKEIMERKQKDYNEQVSKLFKK